VTVCVQRSHTWEANSSSASQEIPCISYKAKAHYPIYNIPINPNPEPDQSSTSSLSRFFELCLNIIILTTYRSALWSLFFRFYSPTPKLFIFLSSPIYATCPAHHSKNDWCLIKSWSSLLCSLLQPRVSSFILGPNTSLSALFWNTLSQCSSPNVRDLFHTNLEHWCNKFVLRAALFGQQNRTRQILNWLAASISSQFSFH
jgi:hypothetical protein